MALLSRQSISVVFPAYNEETNVALAIEQATHCLEYLAQDWEIIVVNDGSHDRTAAIIDQLAARDPRIIPVHHRGGNQGYGAALRSGIQRARKDLIFFSDSDLQFHLNELPLLLIWIEQFDAVIGYRENRTDPLHRKLNAFGWNTLVRLVLGLQVRDIDCAFKLFRTSLFQVIKIDAVGAMVNTDILVQATRMGFNIKEVPVTHFRRQSGNPTGAKLRVIIKAFRELWRLHQKLSNISAMFEPHDRRRQQVPLQFADRRQAHRRQVKLPINFPDRRRRVIEERAAVEAPGVAELPNMIRDVIPDK